MNFWVLMRPNFIESSLRYYLIKRNHYLFTFWSYGKKCSEVNVICGRCGSPKVVKNSTHEFKKKGLFGHFVNKKTTGHFVNKKQQPPCLPSSLPPSLARLQSPHLLFIFHKLRECRRCEGRGRGRERGWCVCVCMCVCIMSTFIWNFSREILTSAIIFARSCFTYLNISF